VLLRGLAIERFRADPGPCGFDGALLEEPENVTFWRSEDKVVAVINPPGFVEPCDGLLPVYVGFEADVAILSGVTTLRGGLCESDELERDLALRASPARNAFSPESLQLPSALIVSLMLPSNSLSAQVTSEQIRPVERFFAVLKRARISWFIMAQLMSSSKC
jgi:hypothetical protein